MKVRLHNESLDNFIADFQSRNLDDFIRDKLLNKLDVKPLKHMKTIDKIIEILFSFYNKSTI